MRRHFVLIVLMGFMLAGCAQTQSIDEAQQLMDELEAKSQSAVDSLNVPDTTTSRPMYTHAPELQIDPAKKYQATLETSAGSITIALSADKTPKTVNNFVFLAREHFYDNTIFHRVIKDFMIQGGDPTGTGTSGPGYSFADEPFDGEYTRGTLAMANAGPDTNGSQFFIVQQDVALPKNYVIFGQVISGMETVDAIANASVQTGSSGERSAPVDPVRIQHVTISESSQ